VGKQRP